MGKSKQTKETTKKFDRNVEISAPYLDPEIIKRIHTPPKGQRLDIKHGGFKALLSDLNSQDSTDELTPLNDNHVPSYIGISCAVSGYSNYSAYNKRPDSTTPSSQHITTKTTITNIGGSAPNRSQTTSPVLHRIEQQVHHITIDKNNIHSIDEERKELTEKLTASATEHMRSSSPCIPPTEDDRHHGAYVGARYCPMPPPSKLVNKHIPLLGIDDDQDPDQVVEEENKVEQKIATLYGDNFVEDWRESMTHKAKKELTATDCEQQAEHLKSPKDLVTLRPTPPATNDAKSNNSTEPEVDIPTPNVKVLAQVEKKFLNQLLSDENPPMPSQSPPMAPVINSSAKTKTTTATDTKVIEDSEPVSSSEIGQQQPTSQSQPPARELEHDQEYQSHLHQSPPMSPDSGKNQSVAEEDPMILSRAGEEHIEYEIRAESPIDNEASPVKILHHQVEENDNELQELVHGISSIGQQPQLEEEELVSFSPEPVVAEVTGKPTSPSAEEHDHGHDHQQQQQEEEPKALLIGEEEINTATEDVEVTSSSLSQAPAPATTTTSDSNDGRYYLNLLEQERSFIMEQVKKAEVILGSQEDGLDEDTVGRIRSAIGKAILLINKKCNQFKELCEANINNDSNEKFATLNDDLAGFWDMLSIQVSDVRKLFEIIWQAEESNWNFTNNNNSKNLQQQQDDNNKSQDEQLSGSSKPVKLSAQKDRERRERLQEHMKQMKQNRAAKSSAENLLQKEESGGGDDLEESPVL